MSPSLFKYKKSEINLLISKKIIKFPLIFPFENIIIFYGKLIISTNEKNI